MSTVQAKVNPMDGLRAAGRGYVGRDESVAYCMASPDRPPTPEHVKPYRHMGEPGVKVKHFGFKDFNPAETAVYGSVDRRHKSNAAEVLDQRKPVMTEYVADRAEKLYYQSVKQGPLGQSSLVGTVKHLNRTGGTEGEVTFGRPTPGGISAGDAAKECIFPISAPSTDAALEHALYSKSHGSYPPGVRKNSPIEWSSVGVDPLKDAFGRKTGRTASGAIVNGPKGPHLSVTKGSADTVSTLLNTHIDDTMPKPSVIPKTVDDFRLSTADPIGKARGSAVFDTTTHPSTYGKPSRAARDAGNWSAADCIRGDYTLEQQAPDVDLGRTGRAVKRPGVAAASAALPDPSRRFGLPSIRFDVPPRAKQSIANLTDFGESTGAAQLLSPSPYADHGIDEKDFIQTRSRGEVRDIFARIGFTFGDPEFEAVYQHATEAYGLTPPGVCSVEEFRRAVAELVEAQEDGTAPAWFRPAS